MRRDYNLREKERKSIFECYSLEEEDLQQDSDSDRGWTRKRLRQSSRTTRQVDFDYEKASESEDSQIFNSQEVVDRLPEAEAELNSLLGQVKGKLKQYKQQFLKEQQELKRSNCWMQCGRPT
jgi:hypothetical protein